jgi:tRNA(Ile)-lysidine synthase
MMIKKIEKILIEQCLVHPADHVLCAVSGGADSVALLVMLKQLSDRLSFTLHAVHLDHCLRPESGDDANFVTELCASLQVPLSTESVDIKALSVERREGLEATGRFARRRFFEQVAREQGCSAIALAHHGDDQAETVLFRLARGSGLTGLAAMRPRSGAYIRPLLTCKKSELCDWLVANGIGWREDASNLDPAFNRNLIRNQILPALRQVNAQVDEALCRFSRQVALEEGFWREQVEEVLSRQLVESQTGSSLHIAVESLLALHPALRRRVIRGILERLRGDLQRFEAGHIDQIEALLVNSRPQVETCLPGAWVARRYDTLEFHFEPPEIESFEMLLPAAGSYDLPGAERLVLRLTTDSAPLADPSVVEFCAGQISFPLMVRSVRSGDRFRPSGMQGHKRLKNYFIDNKIPLETRRKIPVVCAGDTILWLAGERRCEGAWPVHDGPKLQIRLEPVVFVDE